MLSDQQNAQLQAYLDDELDSTELGSVEAWISNDLEAAQTLEALRKTQTILQNTDSPESNVEVAWQDFSKKLSEPTASKPTIRFPIPQAAVAAILILGVVFWFARPSPQPINEIQIVEIVEMVETDLEDTSPIVYIDAESGWTIVWVEPASNELAPAG